MRKYGSILIHFTAAPETYRAMPYVDRSSITITNTVDTWSTGFSRLVDVLTALHRRGELELETVSEASKACSECWSVAGAWREMGESRECVRGIAMRLKSMLDENGRTYHGGRVYVP